MGLILGLLPALPAILHFFEWCGDKMSDKHLPTFKKATNLVTAEMLAKIECKRQKKLMRGEL